jgi:hypothetical protein
MARIFGKIESLKSLKSELENNGIFRFNSVKGINDFLSNYNLEKLVILKNATNKLEEEYFEKGTNLNQKIQNRLAYTLQQLGLVFCFSLCQLFARKVLYKLSCVYKH